MNATAYLQSGVGTRTLQLRAEIYNVTNTASFWLPDFNFGSPGFGSISSTATQFRGRCSLV